MAVEIKSTTTKSTNTTQQQAQQQQQQTARPYRSGGFTPNFGLRSRMASYGSGGDVYEKLFGIIEEECKRSNKETSEEKLGVIKLLKDQNGLNYHGIIVTETYQDVTSAHVLVIEKTGGYPDTITENIGGQRYEIIRTPADALDDKYVGKAEEAVRSYLNTDNVVIVDGTLVPNEFDVDSQNQVNELLINTFNSIRSENSVRVSGYKGTSLAELRQQDPQGKFFVNMYFNGDKSEYFDQTGMPVRQDICIALSYKTNQGQNSRSVNQGNDTFELVRTYGYVDFEYVGPQMINGQMTTQKFVPNFIITHIESTVAPTVDKVLLGVASVLSLNEEMNWMQSFRSTPTRKGEVDLMDIGALNIEGNIENATTGYGAKYNTKAKEFSVSELNNYVQHLVRPYMMVSIDLPKAGPETWYTSVLNHVKFRNSPQAYERVIDAVSALTNTQFDPQAPIFMDVSNKIHGGFYKTKDGFADLRHLSSYLSVANYVAETNQSPELINQYTNTLYNSSMAPELRAAERGKMINEMAGNTLVVKQFHDRVTFNGVFLGNLVGALKNVGFNPMFANMGMSNELFQRRSTVDFSSALLGQDVRLMGQGNAYSGFGWNSMYNRSW